MNLLKRMERNLTALAMAPLVEMENRERDRRVKERMQRAQQKHPAN